MVKTPAGILTVNVNWCIIDHTTENHVALLCKALCRFMEGQVIFRPYIVLADRLQNVLYIKDDLLIN